MSPTGDITYIRAADLIRNPGYRPSDIHEFAHASMAHSWLPSGTFIVNIIG